MGPPAASEGLWLVDGALSLQETLGEVLGSNGHMVLVSTLSLLNGSQPVHDDPRVQKACMLPTEWKCIGLFEWLQWLGCCSLKLVTLGTLATPTIVAPTINCATRNLLLAFFQMWHGPNCFALVMVKVFVNIHYVVGGVLGLILQDLCDFLATKPRFDNVWPHNWMVPSPFVMIQGSRKLAWCP